jgi:uncharacterized damage-inducible protein DinB
MYRKILDFLSDWKYETEGTIKLLKLINEGNRSQHIHENIRSLERLAWHLTQTITEMGHRAGLFPSDPLANQPIPTDVGEIAVTYQNYSNQLVEALKSTWSDADLEDQVDMYGEHWAKGTILRVLINHQTHHRAQMTVIMRYLGVRVPGLYGPAKEEWAEFGVVAPE